MDTWDWTPYLSPADESPEAAHRRWYDAGLADGLPIIPPTAAGVRRLYREAALDPIAPVAIIEPAVRPTTVYDVAVCAVAAGCSPAGLPVVAAALRAVAEPAFNLLGIQTTTGTATPLVLVHGPAAARAGVGGGGDCLGGSIHANATIGRALRLALRILGGAVPGAMDAATMGQPAKLGLCFAENTVASPWQPLHAERGFPAEASAVTVVGVTGSAEIVHAGSVDPDEVLKTLAGSMLSAGNVGSHGLIGGGSPLLVLSPEHASALAAAGLDRAAVCRRLWECARLPITALALSHAERIRRARREAGLDPDASLPLAERPEEILIAVAGGAGEKSTFFPSWGGGTKAITLPI